MPNVQDLYLVPCSLQLTQCPVLERRRIQIENGVFAKLGIPRWDPLAHQQDRVVIGEIVRQCPKGTHHRGTFRDVVVQVAASHVPEKTPGKQPNRVAAEQKYQTFDVLLQNGFSIDKLEPGAVTVIAGKEMLIMLDKTSNEVQ